MNDFQNQKPAQRVAGSSRRPAKARAGSNDSREHARRDSNKIRQGRGAISLDRPTTERFKTMKENYKFVALNIKPHPGVSEEKLIPALEKIMGALDKDLLSFKFQFSD